MRHTIKALIENEELMFVFSWIGILLCISFILVILWCAFDALKDAICRLRWVHTYKHRFGKPPTAACYCKDCVSYRDHKNSDDCGTCGFPGISRWTPEDGFCYRAEPRKKAEKGVCGK